MAAIEQPNGESDPETPEAPWRMKRRDAMRRLLTLAGAAAVGAVAIRPDSAGAAVGTMQYGTTNNADVNLTTLSSSNGSYTFNVLNSGFGEGLVVNSNTGPIAFLRQNGTSAGENGLNIEKNGSGGAGVQVVSKGSGAGVIVYRNNAATTGAAVDASQVQSGPVYRAMSSSGNAYPLFEGSHPGSGRGVQIALTNATNASPAIHATTAGTGRVMFGAITNAASTQHAISAQTAGSGYALYGSTQGAGAGLGLNGGASGRGATVVSNVAHLRLVPSTRSTHPASGATGDLFVDKSRRLWFCKGGASWVQLA
ncbi:MAG TPA: hypothetical protein VFZ83_15735 [Acidimicrobiia bacterium]|nr:hypothetical protein [Acidimicrobiia bacterium]